MVHKSTIPLNSTNVVTSINGLVGSVDLTSPDNSVLITTSGQDIQLEVSGTGSVTSVSGTPGRITTSAHTGAVTIDIDAAYVGQTSINILGTVVTGIWDATPINLSLYASGTLQAAQFPALTGDVTTAAGSLSTSIANNAVTYGKMQAVSTTSKLLGSSSTTTPVQEISLGSGISMSGTTLSATGTGGTVTSVGISGADGISVSGSPITSSGTISLSLGDITPDTITAGTPPVSKIATVDIGTSSYPFLLGSQANITLDNGFGAQVPWAQNDTITNSTSMQVQCGIGGIPTFLNNANVALATGFYSRPTFRPNSHTEALATCFYAFPDFSLANNGTITEYASYYASAGSSSGGTDLQINSGFRGKTPTSGTIKQAAWFDDLAVGLSRDFGISNSGVVTSGAWNANTIDVLYGGTGQTSYTDGQLLIGNSIGNTLTKSTLAAGSGVTITNGNGSITISATGTGGTVTSFSAGNLSPLFTTSVATATTTPALSFSLSNAGANTYFGNVTGSTGAPSYTSAAALTRTNDTNVTLTLGGSPTVSLLAATSLTLGWTGTLAETRGGTNQSTYTLGDTLYASAANTLSKLAGNTTSTKQYLSQTGTGTVSAAPAWATISGGDITGAALTKTDDTNVTLTLGGSPTTALLRASSLTLGWTGQLGLTRGGTNASLTADNGAIVYSTSSALALLASTATANKILLSGSSAAPSWSTSTIPSSAGATANKVLLSDGTNYVLSTPTFPNASASSGKFIRSDGTNWIASTPTLPTSAGTSGKILQSDGTNYVESTPTYPSASGSAGKILRSDGTNNIYTTSTFADTYAASTLLYSNGANTVTGLATGNTGLLTTNGSGVPSITAQAALTKTDDTNVTLTLGGSPTVALVNAASLTLGWTGTLAVGRGGTGTGTVFTAGSVVFAGASGVYSQDNSNLFYDSTNHRFIVGSASTDSTGAKVQARTSGGWAFSGSDGTATGGIYVANAASQPVMFGSYSNHRVGLFTNNGNAQVHLDTTGAFGVGSTSGLSLSLFSVYGSPPSGGQYLAYVNGTLRGASGSLAGLQISEAGCASTGNTISQGDGVNIYANYSDNQSTITSAAALRIAAGATAGTITTGYGIRIDAIGFGTTQYGLFVTSPTGGTNKQALYADNASIGYAASGIPASNSLIVSGSVAIGRSTIGRKVTIDSTNDGLGINYSGSEQGFLQATSGNFNILGQNGDLTLNVTGAHTLGFLTNNTLSMSITPSGTIAMGISGTVATGSSVTMSYATAMQLAVNGTQTSTTTIVNSQDMGGIAYIGGLNPTNGSTSTIAGIYSYPNIYAPSAKTITKGTSILATWYGGSNVGTISDLYGFYFDGGSGAAGTITRATGLYVITPTSATTNNNTILQGDYSVTVEARQLVIRGTTNNNKNLKLGYNTSSNYGSIQATTEGSQNDILHLNINGGNVGVNYGITTATPPSPLSVINNYVATTQTLYSLGKGGTIATWATPTAGLVSLTVSSTSTDGSNNRVSGWRFTTGSRLIRLTHLGAFTNGSVFNSGTITVAMYNATAGGTLVATTTVSSATSPENSFRYSALATDVELLANTDYTVLQTLAAGQAIVDSVSASTYGADVTFVATRDVISTPMVYTNINSGGLSRNIGPGFKYTFAQDALVVTVGNVLASNADMVVNTAGKTLKIQQGSNACAGTGAVMVAGVVTVSTTAVATGDLVFTTRTASGGTLGSGDPLVTIINGVSFTLTSQLTVAGSPVTNTLETSTFSWVIIKAA